MNEIACVSGVQLLMDYLEGVLPAEVCARLEAHVAGCQRCQAFIESYRETPRLLREATDATLPSDIRQSLTDFLRARRR